MTDIFGKSKQDPMDGMLDEMTRYVALGIDKDKIEWAGQAVPQQKLDVDGKAVVKLVSLTTTASPPNVDRANERGLFVSSTGPSGGPSVWRWAFKFTAEDVRDELRAAASRTPGIKLKRTGRIDLPRVDDLRPGEVFSCRDDNGCEHLYMRTDYNDHCVRLGDGHVVSVGSFNWRVITVLPKGTEFEL